MLSVLSKWYSATLVALARDFAQPFSANMYGFVPGCQPLEVTESLRFLLQKRHGWKEVLTIINMDVHKAVDNIGFDILEKALVPQIPGPLRAAFLRELLHNKVTIHVQGIASEPVGLSR